MASAGEALIDIVQVCINSAFVGRRRIFHHWERNFKSRKQTTRAAMRETELAALTHVRFTFRASEYWSCGGFFIVIADIMLLDISNDRRGRVHGHTVIIIDSPKFISL
jgi:hypothetical protein